MEWRGFDGTPLNWSNDSLSSLCLHLRGNAESVAGKATRDEVLLAFNRGSHDLDLLLPPTTHDVWVREIDTAEAAQHPTPIDGARIRVPAQSVSAFVLRVGSTG